MQRKRSRKSKAPSGQVGLEEWYLGQMGMQQMDHAVFAHGLWQGSSAVFLDDLR